MPTPKPTPTRAYRAAKGGRNLVLNPDGLRFWASYPPPANNFSSFGWGVNLLLDGTEAL